uniref:Fc receptor-like protein 5 n=1 Tax=Geotrypetes seraphini TaxID=260995 RepID=A0A6P8PBJ1_GEOSA|nr:Fc receptor-like protein 5 [Geotrypetes seraphini]
MLPSISTLVLVSLNGCLALAVKDLPAAPSLSFTAGYVVYMTGEPATLRCSVSRTQTVLGYQFHKDGGKVTEGHLTPSQGIYSITSVNKGTAGSYSCTYWTLDAGETVLSRESQAIVLYVIDHLPTPVLSLEPPSSIYISGEPVTLRCVHAKVDSITEYHFFKDGADALREGRSPSDSTYRIRKATGSMEGWYSCLYRSETRGRAIRSMESPRQFFSVTAQPPAPSIALHPEYPVYITEEPVTLSCASPGLATVTGYRFYKDGREVTERSSFSQRNYFISGVTSSTAGTYSCIYWISERGRDVPALPSTLVTVVVIEPLHPPVFFLTPSNGRIEDGDNLILTCSILPNFKKIIMLFTRNGEVIRHDQSLNRTESNVRFSFRVSKGNASHEGNYSCYYIADIHGRMLTSPQSNSQQVTVEARKLLWLMLIGLAASLGLILTVFLVIILCQMLCARKGSKTEKPSSPLNEDGEIAYTALTVSTLTSTRSAPI